MGLSKTGVPPGMASLPMNLAMIGWSGAIIYGPCVHQPFNNEGHIPQDFTWRVEMRLEFPA